MSRTYKNKLAIGILWLSLPTLIVLASCKGFTTKTAGVSNPVLAGMGRPLRVSAEEADAAEPATASASDGNLYVAWVNHGPKSQADVMVARFTRDGEMQGSAVRVNQQPGTATAWRGDPPTVATGNDGSVYVGWTARVESEGKVGTNLYLSLSHDRGQTFATEVKVNDDSVPGAHGMHALALARDGRIYVSWLDERNVSAPKPSNKADGHHMESNRELFFAYSGDGGNSFSANRKVASDVCPCCKTALTLAADGSVYVGWRQVLPGDFRHIAVARSSDSGNSFSAPVIVSDDQWSLHGCPVSGPSLLVDPEGTLNVLWYAAGEAAPAGLYSSESRDQGHTFSPRRLLNAGAVRGTPVLTAGGNPAIAIWEGGGAASGGGAETRMMEVGKSGSTVTALASNAELPAGVLCSDRLFVAYIVKADEKRSVWLVRAR